ncbi:MAG: hypothetical protein IPO13_09590 [Rhodocyclaceae bacterium]|nr:hypothetical protein [Rhodocyclaceae bacterium]
MSITLQLWLPILASAVGVFLASSLIHMVFQWHNSEYRKLANEDEVRTAIRAQPPGPGMYFLPHCTDMKEMGSAEMTKKFAEGPVAYLTVRENGPPKMGQSLTLWFIYCVIIAAITGSIARYILGATPPSGQIACVVGTMSFLAFTGGGSGWASPGAA